MKKKLEYFVILAFVFLAILACTDKMERNNRNSQVITLEIRVPVKIYPTDQGNADQNDQDSWIVYLGQDFFKEGFYIEGYSSPQLRLQTLCKKDSKKFEIMIGKHKYNFRILAVDSDAVKLELYKVRTIEK
ncbi:hypothetical protein A2303_01710 [Candidatus Falkowbacteria bacterium RIFOXYB2_FULL_47_14]|uniref:Lipoprotein n=1 Tax=Candidatus Falkowbacteria bacterium RIFOXYA2_FULL_47_19 TaxID=1797994 RepID=A0A1F5SLZ5_9BACT|nr:MAG: hypothetical protein A2227_01785 [Candidatus Falkowbacteria bacterium RIFOXYA2_FULL_47_19]OGF36838.1 MAG: hypothetical protein A2468_07365 [Candidatus Falkowbacteria bacterium RIFOXYC2_FULL_46_15]OGF43496.1 MAG: hypothetical protein A2303_01710 [Candidatus Falkowbacteria bacterium RIFOXYB2_FULL_47_14]